MIVEMEFWLGEGDVVKERDLAAALASPKHQSVVPSRLCGGLHFQHEEATFRIVDEVTWVVWTLALETLPELTRTGASQFSFWSVDGLLDFRLEEDVVTITCQHLGTYRFPTKALIAGTHDAADRLLDLIDAHWPDDTVFDRPTLRQENHDARIVTGVL